MAQPSARPMNVVDKMLSLAADAATEEKRISAMNCVPRIWGEMERAQLEGLGYVVMRMRDLVFILL